MIGCTCSGGGKENYPSLASVDCDTPAQPTNTKSSGLTWNIGFLSPEGAWNKYMPWRSPGSAKPLDSCGIASGFKPNAKVQYPHKFEGVAQGTKGTELPKGNITTWKAGAVVEASWTLIVNHGGGYQFRVCPIRSGTVPNEACFEANALQFADAKSTVRYLDQSGSLIGDGIELAATDVSEGVTPSGKAWRRLPMPACNCDLGADCEKSNPDKFRSAYSKSMVTGSCDTGVQFEAQHLQDGTWPEGYGYFLGGIKPGNLNNSRGYGKGSSKKMTSSKKMVSVDGNYKINWIAGFSDAAARTMSAKAGEKLTFEWQGNNHNVYKMKDETSLKDCSFTDAVQEGTGSSGPVEVQIPADVALGSKLFFACQVGSHCQGGQHLTVTITNETSSSGKDSGKDSSGEDSGKDSSGKESDLKDCTPNKDKAACEKHANEGCQWFDKGICWQMKGEQDYGKKGTSKGADFSGAGTEDSAANWVIVDKLIAPSQPGDYILQWRWDNEQTPQIWTTCADITVLPAESVSDTSKARTFLPVLSVLAAAVAVICAV